MNQAKSLIIALILLTSSSIFIVLEGADREPYYYFRVYDLVTQFIAGNVLILAWFIYSGYTVLFMQSGKISQWWLSSLYWALIMVYYLIFSPLGWLHDMMPRSVH